VAQAVSGRMSGDDSLESLWLWLGTHHRSFLPFGLG
jgi:hypothetical protein